jgi:hypothetical protein
MGTQSRCPYRCTAELYSSKIRKIEALIDVSGDGLETALTCEGLASPKGAYSLRQQLGQDFNRGKINIIDQLTSVNQ